MRILINPMKSFAAKVTFGLILAMLFSGALSDFMLSRYALKTQFQMTRRVLSVIAQTAALNIDGSMVDSVPLTKDGQASEAYKTLYSKLEAVRKISPLLDFVYIMKKTDKPDVLVFVVDAVSPLDMEMGRMAFPGEEYDAVHAPAMLQGFHGPASDKELETDKWGISLSGYAPIKDKAGKTVAVLGIDLAAESLYLLQRNIAIRAVVVFCFGLILSVLLGMFIARKVTVHINELIKGAKNIALGNLDYKVCVKCDDEIATLADVFNKMSHDLKDYISKLNKAAVEKEKLRKELEIAKAIQKSFLPYEVPDIKGFKVAAKSIAAEDVGGDFYDFIPLDNGKWGIAIGDVSGKGIPAALFMALTRTVVRTSITGNRSTVDAMMMSNSMIFEHDMTNMFVTVFYTVIDPATMTLKYVNAGHNPPILLKPGNKEPILLKAKGMPLGISDKIGLFEDNAGIEKGDVIVMYTDGVTEAMNRQDEEFGLDRFTSIVREEIGFSPEEILQKVCSGIKNFTEGREQYDDITIVVVKAV